VRYLLSGPDRGKPEGARDYALMLIMLRLSLRVAEVCSLTRALESGLSYRQVQMMSKHRDPKTVMRYDHGRENLEQNADNFLGYDDDT
jgi:site-specific recombinase XerD